MTQFAGPTPAAPDYDSTIIGALELSEKKWVPSSCRPGEMLAQGIQQCRAWIES